MDIAKTKNATIKEDELRHVAGAFPTGVTIVTTEYTNGDVHGMTASSFLSVSLDPPLVSFCIKEDALLFPLLKIGKVVGISILSDAQQHVSEQFAGFNKDDIKIPMTKTNTGASVIVDALAYYATEIHDIVKTGDHYLVLFEVRELKRATTGNPLVYWSGYRTTGDTLK